MSEWNPTKTRTSWLPVMALVAVAVNVLLVFLLTFASHKITDLSDAAVVEAAGGGEIIAGSTKAGIHVKLIRAEDGTLQYMAYHEMDWMKRYDLISDGAEPVTPGDGAIHEAKCFNGWVRFSIGEGNTVAITDSHVRDYQIHIRNIGDGVAARYVIDGAILAAVEFILALVWYALTHRKADIIINREIEETQEPGQ